MIDAPRWGRFEDYGPKFGYVMSYRDGERCEDPSVVLLVRAAFSHARRCIAALPAVDQEAEAFWDRVAAGHARSPAACLDAASLRPHDVGVTLPDYARPLHRLNELSRRSYRYEQTFRRGRKVVEFCATDLEMRWLRTWTIVAGGEPASYVWDDLRPLGEAQWIEDEFGELIEFDETTVREHERVESEVPGIRTFANTFVAEMGDEPSTTVKDFAPHFTLAELEVMAHLWGWDDWLCAWRRCDWLAAKVKRTAGGAS